MCDKIIFSLGFTIDITDYKYSCVSTAEPITYSFNETLPPEYTGSDTQGWEPVATPVRDVIHEVMAAADGVILPDIESVSGDGLIRFNAAFMDEGIAGYAYLPGTGKGGDVFLDHEVGTDTPNGDIDPYGYGRSTIVHELGHALGLVHPFDGISALPDCNRGSDRRPGRQPVC
jgi:hypothetical protein